MQEIVDSINGVVWSSALIYLALGAGLFFSILTRFVQVRLFREMIAFPAPTGTRRHRPGH